MTLWLPGTVPPKPSSARAYVHSSHLEEAIPFIFHSGLCEGTRMNWLVRLKSIYTLNVLATMYPNDD